MDPDSVYRSGSRPLPVLDSPGVPLVEAAASVWQDREEAAAFGEEATAAASRNTLIAWGVFACRLAAIAAGLSGVAYGYQVLLGSLAPGHPALDYGYHFPTRYFVYGAVFLVAATLFARRREYAMAVGALPCLHHLYDTCPVLLPWVAVWVPALYLLLGRESVPGRRASRRFWIGLALGVILLPKIIQNCFSLEHGSWLDVNQNLFAGLFLRYAYYFYERRRGLVPAGRFWEYVAYLLFIPQVTGMLNVPPSEMHERWGFGTDSLRRGFMSGGWAAMKIPLVLVLGHQVLPVWGYHRGFAALQAGPLWALWLCLLASYLYWLVLVSAKFDLMVALFRFFGLNVDDNFRWPLLATSPLDLWRRWNIYNRRLLLKFVYFPLGGNRRHVYRNIFCTFVASALLLHTGFMGSPWLWVDPGQLRDWLLYFAMQGAVVCGAYWWLSRPFWEQVPARCLWPLRCLGWAFTLLSSAWLHVLPLAAGNFLNDPAAAVVGLEQRLELMLRAVGVS